LVAIFLLLFLTKFNLNASGFCEFFFIIYVGATETGRRRRLAGARVHNTHTHRDASTRESGEINQESTSAKGEWKKSHMYVRQWKCDKIFHNIPRIFVSFF